MSNPFDFVKACNHKKAPNAEIQCFINGDDFSKVVENDFNDFLTNRNFSQFPDTLFVANEMNRYWRLPKRAKFLLYYYGIPKANRFTPWAKKYEEEQETIDLLKQFYKYSDGKAKEILPLIKDEDIQYMKQKLNKGGRK